MKKYAFVLPCRDREPEAVKKCIQSIHNQLLKNFKLYFSDYGSSEKNRLFYEKICRENPDTEYIFSDTADSFWCKPHALNIAFDRIEEEFVITADADMVYAPDFLGRLDTHVRADRLLHYRCGYLPKGFDDFAGLEAGNYLGKLPESTRNATGIFAVPAEKIRLIGGSDEFFMIWGMEDTDISRRLQAAGANAVWLRLEDCPVYHQWHEPTLSDRDIPADWTEVLGRYSKSGKGFFRPRIFPKNYAQNRKPAEENLPVFNLQNPVHQSINRLLFEFDRSAKGIALEVLEGDFLEPVGRASSFIKTANRFLQKFAPSIQLSRPGRHFDYRTARDFAYYFVLCNRQKFSDYRIIKTAKSLRLELHKKA